MIGARGATAVAQWESGAHIPDGLRRERLTALLEGRLWPEVRAALIAGDGMPSRWHQGVRWYRRASRERGLRERAGTVVSAILDELRALGSPEALRRRYVEADGEWAHALADQRGCGDACRADLRRIEDPAYGLRWLEVTRGVRVDLRRSLVPQLPLGLLGAASRDDHPYG